jgi:hypothetical protein
MRVLTVSGMRCCQIRFTNKNKCFEEKNRLLQKFQMVVRWRLARSVVTHPPGGSDCRHEFKTTPKAFESL